MKRIVSLLLILLLICTSLSGCGQNTSEESTDATDAKVYKLRMATQAGTGTEGCIVLQDCIKKIDELTNGQVKIELYPDQLLGDWTDVFTELRQGTIDLAMQSIDTSYDPRLEMRTIPYLFDDYDQISTVAGEGSYFDNTYTNLLADLDITYFGVWVEGLVGIGTNVIPKDYVTPGTPKDILLRCPAMDVYLNSMKEIGYSTIVIPATDLFTSLQTGVCDGFIGGTPLSNYNLFRDVIKYYIPLNMSCEQQGLMASKSVFESLPPEFQAIISDVFRQASNDSFSKAVQRDKEYMDKLQEYGVEILELTDEQRANYVQFTREKVWPYMEKRVGKEIMSNLITEVQK